MYQFDAPVPGLAPALLSTDLPLPKRQGKVRDVYDLGDEFLIVATDRISAFDHVLPCGVPGKGEMLTTLSRHWFEWLSHTTPPTRHHLLTTEVPPLPGGIDPKPLVGRVMVVRKATVVPFECVVRGYLEGSGWKEYESTGQVCGVPLPVGLQRCERLPEPIFTPATKAEEGHDENVTFEQMGDALGGTLASHLKAESVRLYSLAAQRAASVGLLLADTKFEFGHAMDAPDELPMLIDEVLTPDSSRYWLADRYRCGEPQHALDKQFVREFLLASDWDRLGPPPRLPDQVIRQTIDRYATAVATLTGGAR